jgi:S-DNA-T family DNA segregation ATPase FtsK/SpoIIIE
VALVKEIIGALQLFAVVFLGGTAAYFLARVTWWAYLYLAGGSKRHRARAMRRAFQIRRGWKALARRVDLAPLDRSKAPVVGSIASGSQKGPVPRLYPPISTRADEFSVKVRLKTVPGVSVTSIEKAAEDLGNAWRVHRVKVTSPEPGRVQVRAYLREPLEAHIPSPLVVPTPEGKWKLTVKPGGLSVTDPILWGVTEDGDPVTSTFAGSVHGLMAGATRSGKSIQANTLFAVASLTRHVRLVLLDPNLAAVAPWWRTAYKVCDSTDPNDAAAILEEIIEELEGRKDLFWKLRTDRITQFSEDVPLYVIAADEAAAYTQSGDKKASDRFTTALKKLAAQSAKYGGRVWVLTQKPSSEVLSTVIRMNLTDRMCFRVDTVEDFVMVFAEGRTLSVTSADRTLPQGVGIVSIGSLAPQRFRSVYLPTEACWDIGDQLVDAGYGLRPLPGDPQQLRHLSLIQAEKEGEQAA